MKNKTISVRLNLIDIARLEELAKIRSEMAIKSIGIEQIILPKESYSELIRQAILRMYNETLEYLIYESEEFIQKSNVNSNNS